MLEAVAAIIKELDEGRAAMRAVIPQFDREREIYPGWTIKHMLAHITGWDEAARSSLEAHLRHDEAMIPAYRGINEYNEESVRTRGELPYELVLREFELERDHLKRLLAQVDAERWEAKMLLPWGGYAPPVNLIRVWQRHESDHAAELAELITRKGDIVSGI